MTRKQAGAALAEWRYKKLKEELEGRLKTPVSGGRPTDPGWTERRVVGMTKGTLRTLKRVAASLNRDGVAVAPMQIAAVLLEYELGRTSL